MSFPGQNINPISTAQLNTLTDINTQTTIQAQIDAIGSTLTLDDGKIFVGNASNVPTDIAPSGGFTITNTGLATLGPNHGYATTATAAGTTTLTVASKDLQYFTGSTTQTVTLPVVSTLALGWKIRVVNTSTGVVTVNSSGSNLVSVVSPSTCVEFTVIAITGTDATSWSVDFSNAKITNRLITGFVSGAGTVSATDTILQAINKLDGNVAASPSLTGFTMTGQIKLSRQATAISANSTGKQIIGVTSTASARTITILTAECVAGNFITIKDESGAAGTNNITVDPQGAETIDGAATIAITANYGTLRIYSDGTNWFTI